MAYPIQLASVLSGASVSQLRLLRTRGIVVPEVNPANPSLYSFRDVVALRTVAFLRSQTSMQRIGRAFEALRSLEFTGHPAEYSFGTDGSSILFETPEGTTIDLSHRTTGQVVLFPLNQILSPFTNWNEVEVVDFHRPRPHLEVDRSRLDGWPTIENTRIGYDVISELIDGQTVTVDDVDYFFPSVSAAAARDALELNELVLGAA